jgi:DNA-binding GntR family transcriptional regulator
MDQSNRERLKSKISSKKFERMQWDPGLRERKTMTDYLAAALRTAIYDGQFEDNEELNQVELAQFFGVSRVPIREALRQLQAEGLVQNIAHHRTIVAGLTLPQILEAIEMRAVLETHLLRKTAPKFDRSSLERLRKICEETDLIKDYGSRWVLKNWEFHRALYSDSESPAMVDTVERIHLNVERYMRRAGSTERQRQAAAEHWQILKAIERKDYERAGALLEQHILHTGEEIRRNREQWRKRPAAEQPDRPRKRSMVKRRISTAS